MEVDFGDDAEVSPALGVATKSSSTTARPAPGLDGPSNSLQRNGAENIQQPKPQALPARSGPSSILVSPRQKGNPVLNNIRQMPWEFSDIPADYVLGATTCALFLSLTYHRLHPEYVYSRIRGLQHKYGLRILLTMVDINNHEEPLKELSKTSLINNVTLILCWSAQEAGRYLELFKSYERAAPTSIRAHQSTSYSDKLVEFITVPRSINKTDAVSLVSTFGSVRTAVNAAPEEISLVAGWGGKKVQRWCSTVREPFRVKKAAKRGVGYGDAEASLSIGVPHAAVEIDETVTDPSVAASSLPRASNSIQQAQNLANGHGHGQDDEEELEMNEPGPAEPSMRMPSKMVGKSAQTNDDGLSEGVAAALEKLRRQ